MRRSERGHRLQGKGKEREGGGGMRDGRVEMV
jgi:hypothetical protein